MSMESQWDYIEDLMIAKLAGEISAADEQFLEETIAADAAVRARWQEMLIIHSQLKGNYNKDIAWNMVQAAIRRRERNRSRQWVLPAIAAVLILLVGSFYFILQPKQNIRNKQTAQLGPAPKLITFTTGDSSVTIRKDQPGNIQLGAATLINKDGALSYAASSNEITTLDVPPGLDYKLTLSDGSTVWLNAATRLRFPLQFSGARREVTLDGEAYFEVAKNKQKPFIVHAAGINVQVYGTSFNIKAYAGEPTQASLVEGSVKASSGNSELMLTPGKAALLEGATLTQKDFDQSYVLAWMKGFYQFDNEPLRLINATVQRWFGPHFVYSDPSLANIRFSGALEKSQSLETFLRRLCESSGMEYKLAGNEILLSRK